MSKLIKILFVASFLVGTLFNTAEPTFAADSAPSGDISISLKNNNLTENDVPIIQFTNFDTRTNNNCLVVFFDNYNDPNNPKPIPIVTNTAAQPCLTQNPNYDFSSIHDYASFTSQISNGETLLEKEPPGTYQVQIQEWHWECKFAGANCVETSERQSNPITFQVKSATSQSANLRLSLQVNPLKGPPGTTFTASGNLVNAQGAGQANNQINLVAKRTGGDLAVGQGSTNAQGAYQIDISTTNLLPNQQYNIEATVNIKDQAATAYSTLIINSDGSTAGGTNGVTGFPEIGGGACQNKPGLTCTTSTGTACYTQNGDPVDVNITDPKKYVYTDKKSGKLIDEKQIGVLTAIGCIPNQPQLLVQSLLKVVLLMSGGIALLLMGFGAIGMITSAGNPEALKAAQGRFTSAIIGLLFIIFSVLLLQIIGADILSIPGFGH